MAAIEVAGGMISSGFTVYPEDALIVASGGSAVLFGLEGSATIEGTAVSAAVYTGSLYIASTGSALNTTVTSEGKMTAADGAFLSNTTVNSGGLFNGFTMESSNTWTKGVQINGAFVTANDAQLYIGQSASNIEIRNGGVLTAANHSTTLLSKITIKDGGTLWAGPDINANNITLEKGGTLNNFTITADGGITLDNISSCRISGATVKNGKTAELHSGQLASGVTQETNAHIIVNNGALLTSVNAGTGIRDATAALLTIHSGGSASHISGNYSNLTVEAGAMLEDVSITGKENARLFIQSGGSANNIYFRAGRMDYWNHYFYGECYINGGAKVTNVTLAGGKMFLQEGAVLNGGQVFGQEGGIPCDGDNSRYVNASSFLTVSNGAAVSNAVIGVRGYVYLSGTAASTTLNEGELHIAQNAKAGATLLNGGQVFVNASGFASQTTINGGTVHVYASGFVSRTINSGGTVHVNSGGQAKEITQYNGTLNIQGSGSGAAIYGGTVNLNGSATNVTLHGGNINVNRGGRFTTLHISSGASVNGFTYQESRTYNTNMNLFSGTVVRKGANAFIYEGLTASATRNEGNLTISNGAFADKTTVASNGVITVSSGGRAENTVVEYGTITLAAGIVSQGQIVSTGGKAVNTIITSGTMTISSGAVHSGTLSLESWGTQVNVNNGGVIDFTLVDRSEQDDYLIRNIDQIKGSPTFTITVDQNQSEGTYLLADGGENFDFRITVYDTLGNRHGILNLNNLTPVTYGGYLYTLKKTVDKLELVIGTSYPAIFVYANGELTRESLSINGFTLIEGQDDKMVVSTYTSGEISKQGNVKSAVVSSGGSLLLQTGAAAETQIMEGGIMIVSSGGSATNTVVSSGGVLTLSSGAIHKGTLTLENGANVSAASGAGIELSLAGRTGESDYVINDMSLIKGAPTYTIIIDSNQSHGIYKLAAGAEDFTGTITIKTETAEIGSITVNGENYSYNGVTYLLRQQEGELLFTIMEQDVTPPTAPIISADTVNTTSGTVTLTARYSSDTVIKQFSYDGISWENYTSPITLLDNGTLYFRGRDEAGNWSEVASRTVSNIVALEPIKIYSSGHLTAREETLTGAVISGAHASMIISGSGVVESSLIQDGGTVYIRENGAMNLTAINSGAEVYVSGNGSLQSASINYSGTVHMEGGRAENAAIDGGWLQVSSGGVATSAAVANFGRLNVSSGGMAEAATVRSRGDIFLHGGVASDTTINALGNLFILSGTATDTVINSGGNLHIFQGGLHKGTLTLEAGAEVSVYAGGVIDFTLTGRSAGEDYLINDLSLISGIPAYTITIAKDQALGTYNLAKGASSFTGTISLGTEETLYGSITVNGELLVYRGLAYSLDEAGGNLTLSIMTPVVTESSLHISSGNYIDSAVLQENGNVHIHDGAMANYTTINSSGALHIYSGGVANSTTVNQSGYFGIGNGATAYDTAIGYAGALTVWGGGVVSRNTIDTWGAIVLSSGAVARETIVNSKGSLHVYSGAVASQTTIKEGGTLGAGLGATVYETTLDSYGKAKLWGGAVASNTSIGYAAEMTVLSGGLADTNTIDRWGALILSSGAIGNSTTILANAGYHIYDGAKAYTTIITSGAFLGIGLGGTVYNLDVQKGASATFYDDSILRGWNDFAGTITVNKDVIATDAMINFVLTERSAAEGVIISNASGIAGASYYVAVDSSMAEGRYYLAGNAANITSVTIVGTSTKVLAGGEGVNYEGNCYNLNWDGSNALYLDVTKASIVSSSLAENWETPDLGTWDDAANNMAESTLINSDERKDSGILAAI